MKARPDNCWNCGYDIRGIKGHCPECNSDPLQGPLDHVVSHSAALFTLLLAFLAIAGFAFTQMLISAVGGVVRRDIWIDLFVFMTIAWIPGGYGLVVLFKPGARDTEKPVRNQAFLVAGLSVLTAFVVYNLT